MVMKNLWHFTRAYIEHGNSIPLPSYVFTTFTNQSITRRILEKGDIATLVTRRCVGALVVRKLAANLNVRTLPVENVELACLSAILGTDNQDVIHLLSHPGTIQLVNVIFLISDTLYDALSWSATSDVLDVVRLTFNTLTQALPTPLDAEIGLDLTDTSMDVCEGRFELVPQCCLHGLKMHFRGLISLLCGSQQSFRNVSEESVAFHKNVH